MITEAANGNPNIKALVCVAGFAPDTGESSLSLSGKFPDSTLGDAILPVALPGGGQDLYIQPDKFQVQFAADVSPERALLMAATQRHVAEAAIAAPSGVPAWKALPSYMIYGSSDHNIPLAVMDFMVHPARAGKAVVIKDASHAPMVSHPAEVASLVKVAASAP